MRTLLTAAQHRAEAERLLSAASYVKSEKDFTPAGPSQSVEVAALLVARAQVHAMLAATADDVIEAHVHDDHDTPFEQSCAACRAVADTIGDDLIWSKVREMSWRWSDEQRAAEFRKHFGIEPHQATTGQLIEFLWDTGFRQGERTAVCRHPHYPVSRENEYGIDYSDLHADGPSTTVAEAWANVGAYLAQQGRALSAYVVHPDVNIEIADEIMPTHVLRWSSLRALFAEHEQESTP